MREKTCLIVGNGPSLNDVPDDLLVAWQGDSWGCNWIALHDWFRPSFYVNCDKHNLETEYGRFLAAKACKGALRGRFINSEFADKLLAEYPDLPYITPIHRYASVYGKTKFLDTPQKTGFSTAAKTVLFVCMQFAYAAGYKTFLLVGIDHTYGIKQKHFYPDEKAPKYLGKTSDEDKAWRAKCDFGYGLARQFLEERGGRIINLTRAETTTHVFEKGRYKDWI